MLFLPVKWIFFSTLTLKVKTMTPVQAVNLIGGLSKPSKMPCKGYSIPAWRCITGAKMREVKGSICAVCYALKGNYTWSNVKNALEKRFASLSNPLWTKAMIIAIAHYEKSGYFRFHDSGDVQSVEHLENLCEIADSLPQIKFWLPTREYAFVRSYLKKHGDFPHNLTVRLSGLMMDGKAPVSLANKLGLVVSSASESGFDCPASKQGHKCLDCRACWNKSVFDVTYKKG